MKTGFVQFEPLFGDVDGNLERAASLIRGSDADLLVLPELFNTGYVFTSKEEAISLAEQVPRGKTTQGLCKIAKEKGIKIWTWGEMGEEYARTGKDCNYVPLELVGKPSYFVSPVCDEPIGSKEFISVNDLKMEKRK